MSRMWIWGVVALIAIVASFAGALIFAVVDASERAAGVAATQAHTSNILTRSCQDNGNPLRMAVQQMLRDQIAQSKSLDLGRFFPNIPPKVLHRLIREQNERRRDLIEQIRPVDCAALYN